MAQIMEVHVQEQCSAESGDEKQDRKRGNAAKKIKNPDPYVEMGFFECYCRTS